MNSIVFIIVLFLCVGAFGANMDRYYKRKSQSYLDENAKKEGVVVLESGLQYKVLKEGSGAGNSPDATDSVTVHYKGSLISGKVFDSSYDRGDPITFKLDQVIPGWTEGLQLMKEGDTYELVLPYELGYGERGAGESIPAFQTLIFEVELIKVDNHLTGNAEL